MPSATGSLPGLHARPASRWSPPTTFTITAPERSRLHDALVAARLNTTIDQALPHLLPNHNFALKSQAGMQRLFAELPEALSNTLLVAETCSFDLSADLDYALPDPDVPDGYTPTSYLERLCYEAAIRRYGEVSERVEARLREEFHLIEAHGLAGFLLLYREIALIARRIMEEREHGPPRDAG